MMASLQTAAVAVVLCMMVILCTASVPTCENSMKQDTCRRANCNDDYYRRNCRKTCGLCHVCMDVRTDCWKEINRCSKKWMKDDCSKTCRECTDEETKDKGTRDDTTTSAATWGAWSSWSECSATCGTGKQSQTRTCSPSHAICKGLDVNTRTCNLPACCVPADGYWSDWNAWSQCSKTCGGGSRTRTGRCTGQSSCGQPCKGDGSETQECNVNECPTWGAWSSWSECSATCGTGKQSQTRTCSPSHAICKGLDVNTRTCNLPACCVPRDGYWNYWAAWSHCSRTCGGGSRTRTRTCTGQSSCGQPCKGDGSETQECNAHECPSNAVLGNCNASASSGTWKVSGYCDIEQVFESRNVYSCSWNGPNTWERIQSNLQLSPIDPTGKLQRGKCSFEAKIPTDFPRQPETSRQLRYRIIVDPGNTQRGITVSIVSPLTPRLTCNGDTLPEGSQLLCTCNTSRVGEPAGRLLLLFKDFLVETGSYGQKTVLLSRDLSRGDDGATVSCLLDWAKNISADRTTTVTVLYPPVGPTLTITYPHANYTVSVATNIWFRCTAGAGNGQILEIFKINSSGTQPKETSNSGVTFLSYTIQKTTCEDAGMYYCLARNPAGQANSTSVQLNVLCFPQLVSNTTNTTERVEVTQVSDGLFKFEVVAYPVPTIDSFTYFKRDHLSSSNQEPVRSGLMSGRCLRHAVVLHLAICSVNVTGATVNDIGIYYFKVRNKEGNINMTFELSVIAQDDSGQDSSLSFIGLAIAVLVLAFIAASIVFIIKRRRGATKESMSNKRNVYDTALPGVNAEEPTYCNVTTQSVTSACASDNNIYINIEKNTSTKDSSEPGTNKGPDENTQNDLYAVVEKTRQPGFSENSEKPGTSKGPDEDTQNVLYAAVDKSRKPSSHNTEKPAKPAVMPKPMRKGAAGRKPQENGGDGLSATATGKTQAGGVENVVNNNEAGSSDSQKATANEEGLFYTEVDFSQYRPETQRPLPQQKETFYAAVDLQKTAALRT